MKRCLARIAIVVAGAVLILIVYLIAQPSFWIMVRAVRDREPWHEGFPLSYWSGLAMESDDPAKQQAAVEALSVLAMGGDHASAAKAIATLWKVDRSKCIRPLLKLYDEGDEDITYKAHSALLDLETAYVEIRLSGGRVKQLDPPITFDEIDRSIPELVAALHMPGRNPPVMACRLLSAAGARAKRAVPELKALFATHPLPDVKHAIAQAYVEIELASR